MCLAIPGQIIVIEKEGDFLFAEVDFSGVTKRVNLLFTPEAELGDYVIVHVGFALSILSEQRALSTLSLLQGDEA